jgi:hypothetical protein
MRTRRGYLIGRNEGDIRFDGVILGSTCGIYGYLPVDPFERSHIKVFDQLTKRCGCGVGIPIIHAIQMRTGAYKSRHSSYVTFFNESLFVSILRLRSGGKERYD